jgi:hypothetical protein
MNHLNILSDVEMTISNYERQLNWRLKQLELGKSSEPYRLYIASTPKTSRNRDNPWTPDPYDARMSKRQFEGRIKAWRTSVRTLMKSGLRDDKGAGIVNGVSDEFCLFVRKHELERFKDKSINLFIEPDEASLRTINRGNSNLYFK